MPKQLSKRLRNRRYNRSPRGRARLMRWRTKKREKYLRYLRHYHREHRRAELLKQLHNLSERKKKLPEGDASRILSLEIRAIQLKLDHLEILEAKDKPAA